MKRKQIISLVLAAWLCVSMLASCTAETEAEASPSVDTATPVETAAEEETIDPNDRSHIQDGVPADVSFDGETVRVLYRATEMGQGGIAVYDVCGTDNSGDYVMDSVWNRNRTVEERLGITLETVASMTANLSAMSNLVKNLVMADMYEYDYINTTGNTSITAGLNGYLRDLSDMPYADYDQPWWWKQTIRDISLDGKTFNYLYSDALIYCYIQTGAVYYNKDLYGSIFGDPDAVYQEVIDGTWTIDRLGELTAAAYNDANGDGIENLGDIFGALKTNDQTCETQHFLQGFNIEMYHYDENDKLIIEFDKERASSAVEKLGNFLNNTAGVQHSDDTIDFSDKYFAAGTVLFLPARLARAIEPVLRDMEDAYGILPYPKLDTAQAEYASLIHDSSTNLCVMRSVPEERLELIGATLEVLSAESYRSVMPKFLETALKVKYTRDELSGQVIDIIVASVRKNPLIEYPGWTSDIFAKCLLKPAIAGSNTFASAYESTVGAAQEKWDKAVEKLSN